MEHYTEVAIAEAITRIGPGVSRDCFLDSVVIFENVNWELYSVIYSRGFIIHIKLDTR